MKLSKEFVKVHDLKDSHHRMIVELNYSIFHKLAGNKVWFCRIWVRGCHQYFYSDNKFNAYRQAYNKIKYLIKQ